MIIIPDCIFFLLYIIKLRYLFEDMSRAANTKIFSAIWVLTATLWCASSLYALDPKKRITQYDLRVYKAEHGLPMNDVKDVFQDSKGYLWLACQEGLVRFDGTRFVLYDQSRHPDFGENFIWDIAEDDEHNLWIATNGGGVKRFDGRHFAIFDTSKGLASNVVKRILIGRDRTLWLGTENGLTRMRDGDFSNFRLGNTAGGQEILALHEDPSGDVLAGSNQSGLHVVRHDSVFTLPLDQCVLAFGERASGEIILGVQGNKLYRYHLGSVQEFNPHEVPSHAGRFRLRWRSRIAQTRPRGSAPLPRPASRSDQTASRRSMHR